MTRSRVISWIRHEWPRAGTSDRPGLVDHLLVELADPATIGQVDPVEPAVGDRAGIGDRELPGALAAANRSRRPVPDEARAKLGELLRRVAAVEHVEHVLELLARELRERLGRGHEPLDLVDPPLGVGDHRDEVLGEDVERVARDHRLLDLAGRASASRRRRTRAGRRGTSGRSGPSRPRRAHGRRGRSAAGPRDRLRRLDLDHEVDRAHVDPELERGGGDQAGELPGLEQLLDHEALLVGERAVVGPGDLLVARQRACGGLDGGAPAAVSLLAAPAACASVCDSPPLSSAFISLSRFASRSAPRRLLTKMIVEVCSRTSSSSSG